MRINLLKTGIVFLFLIILFSCRNSEIEQVLVNARDNRVELEKVLDYYGKNPDDSLKLEAARFLIKGMPYHYSFDTSSFFRYRPVIDTMYSLRNRGVPTKIMLEKVHALFDSLVVKYPLWQLYSKTEEDLSSIKAELLIHNIEQAFEYYNKNPFKAEVPFNVFLEYILPYRAKNGVALEEWRNYFIQNYPMNSQHSISNMNQMADSLLYNFKDIQILWMVASQFPYLKVGDYLRSRTSNCPEKCWLNCMLLRSFGIPVSIDFVPACRVHQLGHSWNSLILRDTIYPFDPFWKDNVYNLSSIYSGKEPHPEIGPIQFPKVYREMYSSCISELLQYHIDSGKDIPPFFKNPFLKDVTVEYLKTYEIKASLSTINYQDKFAYACVLGKTQNLVPVGHGKISKGKVSFTSLGPENVYFPVIFKYGELVPVSHPVLLKKGGESIALVPDTSITRTLEIKDVGYQRPSLGIYKASYIGATLEGANNKNFEDADILFKFQQPQEPGSHYLPIQTNKKYRYIRMVFPTKNVRLREVNFYDHANGEERELKGEFMSSLPKHSNALQNILDGNLLTGIDVKVLYDRYDYEDGPWWIGYDLKSAYSINAFRFYYVFSVNVRIGGIYELLYWDFGWKSLGIKTSESTDPVSFRNVPENVLLMIKIHDSDAYSRPFTWSDGKQNWW